jgi:hypothetical protein
MEGIACHTAAEAATAHRPSHERRPRTDRRWGRELEEEGRGEVMGVDF